MNVSLGYGRYLVGIFPDNKILYHTFLNSLCLTIFYQKAYLTFKSIFHKTLNLFYFDCEITLEFVHGTNQYLAIRVKFLAQGNNGGL